MVIRLRIYHAKDQDFAEADRVFYELVKPVHEKHGAKFIGRYRDESGKHFVMWEYENRESLNLIQELVAKDQETIRNRDTRLSSGFHAVPFEEYVLESTQPNESGKS